MKFVFALTCLLMAGLPLLAQDDQKSPPTNFDEFVSKHGGFVQIEDFPLTRMILELSYGETRVRKVTVEGQTKAYYQVTSGQYNGSVAAEDFPGLMDAYAKLKSQALDEKKNVHEYYENKYIDRGGLEIGYLVERKKLTWFMKPHRFGARTLFLKDPATMESSLKEGAAIIQKLKQ